ncbi:hypothetical protein GCK72_013533 [Caenorhabditis remanei]|uniref:Major facilitator superfamily (MFS) profile domain-containing protein n=2 Tax=Caenorhabditis remanei TaxID=31234 RepID=E3MR42_CAERE|nr:hypothetical protein GCK72_013533 [Caenorhabditis remanei]EFP07276.1 hypothetical protein CRE_13524 [Caenorhabditis remanei]KAF1757078.1 hypothetical protein GCK72_013533 [Caenorhabditis remanei]
MIRYLRMLGMEIPLFLYMLGSYLNYPVFQNLIYEKECLIKYEQNVTFCRDVSGYNKDLDIQAAANHFYFISSLTLLCPSLVTTLLLGAATDFWSIKIPLIIPYIGCILGTINYVFQSYFIHTSVYFLLISDALFGLCGGFIAIISTTLTYGVKTSMLRYRSYRIAGVEGAIGLGGTVGFALSGTIREACGYAVTFLIILGLQLIALLYLLILAKETEFEPVRPDEHTSLISTTGKQLISVIREFYRVLTKSRPFRLILSLNLLAFGVEMLIFSGLSDIQYSYLRYKLQWGDKKYGWFSGLSYGITTATVLFLYPLLRMKWMSDGMLATVGLFFKMISLFMFAFVQNEVMAYSIAVVVMFNRFVSTGFRAFISSLIDMQEQGKIFSVIALLEGITTLVATSIYNNLYPKTLSFFPGLLYLISAALLLVPLTIVSTSDYVVRNRRPEVSEGILNSHNDVIDEVTSTDST